MGGSWFAGPGLRSLAAPLVMAAVLAAHGPGAAAAPTCAGRCAVRHRVPVGSG
jgi:hypothetical protein